MVHTRHLVDDDEHRKKAQLSFMEILNAMLAAIIRRHRPTADELIGQGSILAVMIIGPMHQALISYQIVIRVGTFRGTGSSHGALRRVSSQMKLLTMLH